MVIADRSVCDSYEEWCEKSLRIHRLLDLEPDIGLQIRNKSVQSDSEMSDLISQLTPNERLWINGGWPGYQAHLTKDQHSTFVLKQCGISVHSVLAAEDAQERGAAFIQAGPIFNAFSKPVIGKTPKLIEAIVDAIELPVVAVGGITPERSEQCFAVGAAAVATISWVMNAPSVEIAIKDWLGSL